MNHSDRVAVVMSEVFLRRLTPVLKGFVRQNRDYWIIDIYRPLKELKATLRTWRPAGLITEWLPEITEELLSLKIPTIIADTDTVHPQVGSIDVDDEQVGQQAGDYFLNQGHKHFAFFGNATPYSQQRYTGFCTFLGEAGFEPHFHQYQSPGTRNYMEYWRGSETGLVRWLQQLPKPIGILAAHDPLGRCLSEVCRDHQIAIPEEVSILGVNDDPLICNLANPPLSSISIPWDKIGFTAATLMDQVISQKIRLPQQILIPPQGIVTRQSSNLLAIDDPQLARAIRFIRENACRSIQVNDIARAATLPRRTLEQRFQKNLKRSPRSEIMRVRCEEAKRLLLETDLSMPLIAERCGFSNAERFSVVFKQTVAQTPSAFRKSQALSSQS